MGNPHRKRGTGKGTASAWRSVGFEGEPVSTEVFVQSEKPKSNIINFSSGKPVDAESLHSGPVVHESVDRTSVYRTGPTPETAARKPLAEESDAEKIAKLEEKMQSDEFSDEEREYIDHVTNDYSKELHIAKKKMKDKGAKTDYKWAYAVRQIFITDRIRFGLDKKRWGIHGPLAPEKAETFEKYLNLKLPVGIPEEKMEIDGSKTENATETNFTPEQMAQIRVLLEIAVSRFKEYYMESTRWDAEAGGEVAKKRYILDQMKTAMENFIRNDQFLKDIFPEEKISEAVDKTMEFAGKFDITK